MSENSAASDLRGVCFVERPRMKFILFLVRLRKNCGSKSFAKSEIN
jgi:hypothetical protein